MAVMLLAACSADTGSNAAPTDAEEVVPGPSSAPAPETSTGDAAPEGTTSDEPTLRDFSIEVTIAEDLDASIAEAVRGTLEVAHEEWSLAWPVEYYVVGTDRDAAERLAEQYCTVRQDLGQLHESQTFEDCVIHSPMLEFVEVAASGGLRAGWGADPAWRTHIIFQSAPFGLLGESGDPGDADLQQVLHETWHAVQNQAIDPSRSIEDRNELMGPVWFAEGSAEYMGQYLRAIARSEGRLPDVPSGDAREGGRFANFSDVMRNNLFAVDPQAVGECAERSLISIVSYEDPCFQSGALALGPWAIAYLASLAGQNALLTDLHPRVEELGWQAAFEATAGMTLEEFDDAFTTFMAGSTEERMAILPDVGGA